MRSHHAMNYRPHCSTSLQDISNHRQQLYCLFNSLFRLTTMKTPKPHIIKLWRESIDNRCFPSQRVSNAEIVSKSWHHHDFVRFVFFHSTNRIYQYTSTWRDVLMILICICILYLCCRTVQCTLQYTCINILISWFQGSSSNSHPNHGFVSNLTYWFI